MSPPQSGGRGGVVDFWNDRLGDPREVLVRRLGRGVAVLHSESLGCIQGLLCDGRMVPMRFSQVWMVMTDYGSPQSPTPLSLEWYPSNGVSFEFHGHARRRCCAAGHLTRSENILGNRKFVRFPSSSQCNLTGRVGGQRGYSSRQTGMASRRHSPVRRTINIQFIPYKWRKERTVSAMS